MRRRRPVAAFLSNRFVRGDANTMIFKQVLAGAVLLGSVAGAAQAAFIDYPGVTGVRYQTSGRTRAATIGDWYTSNDTSSADRTHRVLVEITNSQLAACGGTCDIIVLDAESTAGTGDGDEVNGGVSDPTRFALANRDGSITLAGPMTINSGTADGTNITFQVSQVGIYQITSVTGGTPISGDNTGNLNDDDNSWGVRVEGANDGGDGIVGLLRTSFQQDTGALLDYQLYFLLGPANTDSTLTLRNFDLDLNATGVTYTRPTGSTVAGTVSDNGVWNGGGSLNAGQDSLVANNAPPTTATHTGVWGYSINGWTSNNQTVFEVNGAGVGLPVTDRVPTRAGNATFTFINPPTSCANPGSSIDYTFSLTNNYFTNDILNMTLSAVPAGWTAQILQVGGAPLTDSDNITGLNYLGTVYTNDSGLLLPAEVRNFILRVTPSETAIGPYVAQVNGLSYMDNRVNSGVNTVFTATQATYVCPSIAKAFTPATVGTNTNATMTLTLTNRNTVALSGTSFTDAFPANLVNATPVTVGGSCVGVATSATAGGNSFNVTNGTIPAAVGSTPGSCTITDQVLSATTGSYNNTTGGISGNFAGTPIGAGPASNTATLTVTGPVLTLVKSSTVFSDPLNGTTNPKRIPGSFVDYSIAATNSGAGAVDANTVFVIDPIPANTELFVGDITGVAGSGPVSFTQGSTASGLSYTYGSLADAGDDVSFSNNGGSSFAYTPVANANGTDPAVTHIRVNPKSSFLGASGGNNPAFTVVFRVRVQ